LSMVLTLVNLIPMAKCVCHSFGVYNDEYLDYNELL